MTAQTARLLVDGNGQVIPDQYYDAATNSFIASEGGTGISVGGTAVSLAIRFLSHNLMDYQFQVQQQAQQYYSQRQC